RPPRRRPRADAAHGAGLRGAAGSYGPGADRAPRDVGPDARMNILFVTPLYLPFVGGLERLAVQLIPRLRARGHSIRVLTSTDQAGIVTDEVEGTAVLRVDSFRFLSQHDAGGLLAAGRAVQQWVDEFGADVVHAHSASSAFWMY